MTFKFLRSCFIPFTAAILRLYKVGLFDWYSDQRLRKRSLGFRLAFRIRILFAWAWFGHLHYSNLAYKSICPSGKLGGSHEAILIARRTLCQLDSTAATAVHHLPSDPLLDLYIEWLTFCSI